VHDKASNSYTWQRDGRLVAEAEWAEGEKDGFVGNFDRDICGYMIGPIGKVGDGYCDGRSYAICELWE